MIFKLNHKCSLGSVACNGSLADKAFLTVPFYQYVGEMCTTMMMLTISFPAPSLPNDSD